MTMSRNPRHPSLMRDYLRELAMSEITSSYRPRCKYLTCKSMLVFGENFESDPEYEAGMTRFWCVQTSKGQGPDGDDVSHELCSNPERACFQEY